MRQKTNPYGPVVVSGLLVLAVLAIYLPVLFLGFTNYDDPLYVTENPWVPKGLTAAGIKWAFSHAYSANWHPLTWLSHMLDVQLYALRAPGHHVTNVIFHAANSVILFLWLRSLTGSLGRSALVAALFALHPIHVESVAWVSERKDVLSAFFGLLSLWAYTRYARNSKIPFLILSLLLFACGLMSKPMLVTWPFVMLLLDFWPLGRIPSGGMRAAGANRPKTRTWGWLVVEKVPFLLLSAAVCLVTLKTQSASEAVAPLTRISLAQRLGSFPVAYVRYLGKTLWPADLAVIYPLSNPEWWVAAAAALSLLGATIFAFRQRQRRPYLLTGWLWFLGMLVPVIGLVQVGNQSIADRYTYLPSIGLFILIVWFGAEFAVRSLTFRNALAVGAVVVLALCSILTGRQLLYWQTSETLFRHTIAVTGNNVVAWINLGAILGEYHEMREAAECYRRATEISPSADAAWYNLGCVLGQMKRNDEAITAYGSALRANPKGVKLRNNLATALAASGRLADAEAQLQTAIELDPSSADLRNNLGGILAQEEKWDEAALQFNKALALDAGMSDARAGLAGVLAKGGHYVEAINELSSLVAREPDNRGARLQLAGTYSLAGDTNRALQEYSAIVQANPKDAVAHSQLAALLKRSGDTQEAIRHYRAAIAARPGYPEAMNNLAWTLATNPNPAFRNGPDAVLLAERACQLTGYSEAALVGTLAASYAEAGRFTEAVATAEKARALATVSREPQLVAKNEELIQLYRSGKPYRDLE